MTDTFAEQLVKKTQNSSDSMKKVLILAGGGIIIALLIYLSLFITPFALLLAAGAVYALYMLLVGLNIEYEYTVTNGTIDIDKIIAKRKRVSMISVDVKDFTAFDSYPAVDDEFSGTTILTTGIDKVSGEEKEPYYADFSHESYGDVRLVFSPDEKILECIKPYLPRNLKH